MAETGAFAANKRAVYLLSIISLAAITEEQKHEYSMFVTTSIV